MNHSLRMVQKLALPANYYPQRADREVRVLTCRMLEGNKQAHNIYILYVAILKDV
jgi:hypothetical protein